MHQHQDDTHVAIIERLDKEGLRPETVFLREQATHFHVAPYGMACHPVQHLGFLGDIVDQTEDCKDNEGNKGNPEQRTEGILIFQGIEAHHQDKVSGDAFPEEERNKLIDASPIMRAVDIGQEEEDRENQQGKHQFLDTERLDHVLELQSFREDVEDGKEEDGVAHRQREGNL